MGESIHVHKPKAPSSVREFAAEIGVIVLGILIALGLEQLAEQWHWRQRVHEVHDQLIGETSRNAGSALEWLVISPCFDQQLAAADQEAWEARRSGSAQPAAQPFSPTLLQFTSDSWLNARSLQVADHLSQDEVHKFTGAYFFASEMTGNITTLHAVAGELEPLSRPLDHVTPAEADELIGKIGRVKELQARMELASVLLIRSADMLHAPIPLARVQDDLPIWRKLYGPCAEDPAATLKMARSVDLTGSGDNTTAGKRGGS